MNDPSIYCYYLAYIDPYLDYQNYLHVNNPNARDLVLEQIIERSLIDPFRELYPDLHRNTRRKKSF
jgi:hypothetical protein